MKRIVNRTLVVFAILAVFGVSFIMGRGTAIRSGQKLSSAVDEAERAVAVLPLLRASEAEIPPLTFDDGPEFSTVAKAAESDEEVEEEHEEPPFPLMAPTEGEVAKDYSMQAVYSNTMSDWRAHTGVDIEADLAAAVMAAEEGTVSAAYSDKLWGNVIEIQHKGGLKTVYKGVSTLDMVRVGEEVTAGKVISGVGTSPVESKDVSHLHFEVWQDEVCINPESCVLE